MKNTGIATLLSFALIALVVACGGSYEEPGSATEAVGSAAETVQQAGEDVAGAVEGVVEEAKEMAPEQIKAKVEEYTQLLAEKEAKLKEIADKLKAMSPTDLTGDTAKTLRADSEALTAEIASIKEKLQAFKDQISG